MPATTVYQLPYPTPSDPADVPADMQRLANRVEAVVVPGTANGQVPVWDNTAKKWVPGSELAYVQITAPVSVTVTTEATAVAVVTAPAVTFDGSTPVIVEFVSSSVQTPNVAGQGVILYLFDGSTSLGFFGVVQQGAAGVLNAPVHPARRLTPAAGAHTYGVRASSLIAGSTPVVNAGGGAAGQHMPAFIRITRA